jgi:hypothetical protein
MTMVVSNITNAHTLQRIRIATSTMIDNQRRQQSDLCSVNSHQKEMINDRFHSSRNHVINDKGLAMVPRSSPDNGGGTPSVNT